MTTTAPEHARYSRLAGVTLIELLVVVAIVALLSTIAYPSYIQYVTRTNRSAAKSMLMQIADRQEQFFADNKRYANDLTDLGYGANGFPIDAQGRPLAGGDADRIYQIALSNLSATTFTVNAAPQLHQASRDTACQTLTLTQAGTKGQTGSGNNCW